jgi:hypothetical protein
MRRSVRLAGGVVRLSGALALLAMVAGVALYQPGCSSSSSTVTVTVTATALPTPSPVAFVPNTFAYWDDPANFTTSYGPAYADILLKPTNFVPCLGGPFALCYYSGPQPEACTLTADGKFANCECFSISFGQYFVDINAILNAAVYEQTVDVCGADGAQCQTLNSAPVCQAVNQGQLIPGADMISTFSFDCVPSNGIGQTSCGADLYAGCMTAGCHNTDPTTGLTDCQCPAFNGPFQIGQNNQQCTLGGNEIWSAAYAPPPTPPTTLSSAGTGQLASNNDASQLFSAPGSPQTGDKQTYPQPSGCLPDAPGSMACPLYVPGQTVLPPNSGVDCAKVCSEYNSCVNTQSVQVGYSCDSTLCTRECNDRDIVGQACTGLGQCDVSEIIKAETAASCSCCASQLCGCSADTTTNNEIYNLVAEQNTRGITSQCKINGTLCGTAP